MRNAAIFYLNGVRQEVAGARAGLMLTDYLREDRALTGTKVVCAEGDCGACTVLRAFPLRSVRKRVAEFLPVNACITTVAQMDGSSLVTIEALSGGRSDLKSLTPTQRAMVDCHGSQCGFCTPGFVMALTGLVEKRLCRGELSALGSQESKNALTGNLCRCTGYQPILDAAAAIDLSQCESLSARFWTPAQQRDLKRVLTQPLHIESDGFQFFAPRKSLEAARALARPSVRVFAAGTDLGVVQNKQRPRAQNAVSLHLIPDLYSVSRIPARKGAPKRMRVGARVTLSELRWALQDDVPEFARFLDLFASPQIKNVATLTGNVANASPIGDTPPFLIAANATLHIQGPRTKRTLALEKFYLGYRKTALKAGELIAAIEFDIPHASEKLALYKVSQRKDLDISTVNAAFRARFEGSKLFELCIAMGGMAATPIRLHKTERVLRAGVWTPERKREAGLALQQELKPLSDLRGSSAYRRVAAEALLQRFLREHGSST